MFASAKYTKLLLSSCFGHFSLRCLKEVDLLQKLDPCALCQTKRQTHDKTCPCPVLEEKTPGAVVCAGCASSCLHFGYTMRGTGEQRDREREQQGLVCQKRFCVLILAGCEHLSDLQKRKRASKKTGNRFCLSGGRTVVGHYLSVTFFFFFYFTFCF